MSTLARRLLLWSPRILGAAVAIFLGLFSLNAFEAGKSLLESLPHFLLHVTPAFLLLLVVVISWRWELVTISGPLFLVGSLFVWSWRHRDELRTRL